MTWGPYSPIVSVDEKGDTPYNAIDVLVYRTIIQRLILEVNMSEDFNTPGEVTSDDKLWALLAYLLTPLVPIIIMLMEDKKNRPFLKAHNGQALVIGVIQIILWSLSFTCITGIIALVILVAQIYWAVQAYQGNLVTIPVITDFVKNQGWA
jgi:uncharacterized protein